MLLAWKKIKIQNLKYDFYQMSTAFTLFIKLKNCEWNHHELRTDYNLQWIKAVLNIFEDHCCITACLVDVC